MAEPAPKAPCAAHSCSAPTTRRPSSPACGAVHADAAAGRAPAPAAPVEADLRAAERIAIDYADAGELADKVRAGARRLRAAGPLEGPARPRHLPRQRAGAEGRLPLHRPGLAVRQHAGRRSATSSRSSPQTFDEADADHDAADRPAAHVVPVRRPRRPRRGRRGRGRPAPDRDHPARRAVGRPRHHPPARRLRHRARPRDGPQPRRVRRPRRRRGADVPGRARGGQRPGSARWRT